MQKYGKLIDGQLAFLSPPLKIGGQDTYTNDATILRAQGWKPVVFTDPPEQEGHYATSEWAETADAITQVWTLHETQIPVPSEHEAYYNAMQEVITGG